MKLKVSIINGFIALVDENAEIKDGDLAIMVNDFGDNYIVKVIENSKSERNSFEVNLFINNQTNCCEANKLNKIIFAEKELNLEVPVLPNWGEWEVEQLAKKELPDDGLIDMGNWISSGYDGASLAYTEEQIIRSLQKFPKYIVMESVFNPHDITIDDFCITCDSHGCKLYDDEKLQPKLTTNSDGKLLGIIKEIIY